MQKIRPNSHIQPRARAYCIPSIPLDIQRRTQAYTFLRMLPSEMRDCFRSGSKARLTHLWWQCCAKLTNSAAKSDSVPSQSMRLMFVRLEFCIT